MSIPARNSGSPAHGAAAIGCAAGSALLAWAALNGAPGLRVPAGVALGIAGVVAVAAWRLWQLYRGHAGAGDGAAALVLAGMAGFCLWVALGAGPRACGVGTGGRPLAQVGGLACRVPFGVGGVLVSLATLYAVRRWIRGAPRG